MASAAPATSLPSTTLPTTSTSTTTIGPQTQAQAAATAAVTAVPPAVASAAAGAKHTPTSSLPREQLLGRAVAITRTDGGTASGFLASVDPESGSCVLLKATGGGEQNVEATIVLGHAITSVAECEDRGTISAVTKLIASGHRLEAAETAATEEPQVARDRVEAVLTTNHIAFERRDNGATLWAFEGAFVVRAPFTLAACGGTNPTILARVRKLLKEAGIQE